MPDAAPILMVILAEAWKMFGVLIKKKILTTLKSLVFYSASLFKDAFIKSFRKYIYKLIIAEKAMLGFRIHERKSNKDAAFKELWRPLYFGGSCGVNKCISRVKSNIINSSGLKHSFEMS